MGKGGGVEGKQDRAVTAPEGHELTLLSLLMLCSPALSPQLSLPTGTGSPVSCCPLLTRPTARG